jgi:hypothetical protein
MSRRVLDITIIEIDLEDMAQSVWQSIQDRDPKVCESLARMGIDPTDPDLATVEGVHALLVALAQCVAEEQQGRGA